MTDPAERVFRALYRYTPDAECPVDQHRLAFLRRVLGAIDAAGLEVITRVMPHFALEAWTKNVELLTDARAEITRLRARVEVLERVRAAAQAIIDYEDAGPDAPNDMSMEWEEKFQAMRDALKETAP